MSRLSHEQTRSLVEKGLRRRYRAERRFRLYGLAAVLLGVVFVVFLFGTIFAQGMSAFRQAELTLDIYFDPAEIDPAGTRDPDVLATANYTALIRAALGAQFPGVEGRAANRALHELVSSAAPFQLQHRVEADPAVIGTRGPVTFMAGANVDQLLKGHIDR